MDTICRTCGEPWSIYHIKHDSGEGDFELMPESDIDSPIVVRCPCCGYNMSTINENLVSKNSYHFEE